MILLSCVAGLRVPGPLLADPLLGSGRGPKLRLTPERPPVRLTPERPPVPPPAAGIPPAAGTLTSMLSADLRHALAAAARAAGHPGPVARRQGFRDGGAPGRYASSLPLRFADPPWGTARAMAVALRAEDWIANAEPTGHGYLTITVTPEALTGTAVEAAETGPACTQSNALAGTHHAAAPHRPAARRRDLGRGQGNW